MSMSYAFIGGTTQAIKEALALTARGDSVTLYVRETYLAADICSPCMYEGDSVSGFPAGMDGRSGDLRSRVIPDEFKRSQEEICDEAGIGYLYGVTAVGYRNLEEEKILYLTGKGGIFQVHCQEIQIWDYGKPEEDRKDIYCALTGRDSGESSDSMEYDRLEAEFFWKKDRSTAANLLNGRGRLLEVFEKAKGKDPYLRLGRMGYKSPGMCGNKNYTLEESTLEEYIREDGGEERRLAFDVVVAGGGTAGAMAALYAARGGARTVLVEPQYDLGGTSTLGGVSTYWFGMRYEDVQEIDREVDEIHRRLSIRRRKGIWNENDDWHSGVKGYVLLRLCLEAGVEVVFGQIAYGVVLEKSGVTARVTGIRTAGDMGNCIYSGKAVIDATGDGDLAVAAGSGAVYGSEVDGITYWASLAQYINVDEYRNNFSSTVLSYDPEDMTRFIRLGRRRGGNTFDHGSYVSMRESRHITGKSRIDLRDLCCFQTYEDGLYTCYSNYDPKGKLDGDMVYCGYLPPQVRIQIPLSALIPADHEGCVIKGVFVVGKAISATHNVFPSIRMQSDLMHQGAVLGMLIASSLELGMEPDQYPWKKYRAMVKERTGDSLTLEVNRVWKDMEGMIRSITADTRSHWVDVPFLYEEKEGNPLLEAVCAKSHEILPVLKKVIGEKKVQSGQNTLSCREPERNEGERTLLMRLKHLALWHGCDDDTDEIVQEIVEALKSSGDGLPERKGSCMCARLLPDHGVMPETVYALNLLSCSRKEFDMKPFKMVCDSLEQNERDYLKIEKGIFSYMESLAYVGERTGRREFIPLLKRLIAFPEFDRAGLPENQVELMSERLQLLQVILLRGLAVLGDTQGLKGLQRLLHTSSGTVRTAAARALAISADGNKNKNKDRVRIW